jgi:transcriptional regulator with XRE-family HTH domain
MGAHKRMPVAGLPEKLLAIRLALGLTQEQMLERLAKHDRRIKELKPSIISNYELGHRQPPIPVVWAYAEEAGVCMGILCNPKKKLPEKLPVVPGHKPEG